MAQFDESKVINALHLVKADVGKWYYFSDNLVELKDAVESNCKSAVGILTEVDGWKLPFRLEGRWYEFIYPYEDTSEQGMTNGQIAEWLVKGNGQWKYKSKIEMSVCTAYMYDESKENVCPKNIIIRPFGTDKWIKPTVAIYERDCRKR